MKLLPLLCIFTFIASASAEDVQKRVGPQGNVGCLEAPHTVSRLEITKPGVYENYRIDAAGKDGNTVKITADNVTLRHCEIFNGTGNAIGVFGTHVVIESCLIHHMLKGTFDQQSDAHGITGRWGDVTIRDCDISHVSGDCIQFDPDRLSQGRVSIKDCHLWTGPLPADALGFKAGQRPGENAVDTKTQPSGPRCVLSIRNCFMHGWNQPAQITTVAALNIKENVDAEIVHCVFQDNEVALRLRGPGKRGGAHVMVRDCDIYRSKTGVRAEDKIELLHLRGLGFSSDVAQRLHFVGGKNDAGFQNDGERGAPPIETLLSQGYSPTGP